MTISNLNVLDVKNSLKGVRNTLRKENKLGRKECGMKVANWTFNIGEIVELKIANGQGIARIAELKNANKHFWVENNELRIAKQHNQDFSIKISFSIKMLVC